jgi:guanylate kinase
MDIDVFGKKKFDESYPQAVGVLVVPPGLDVLRQRLEGRRTDSPEVVDLRIANAEKEMVFAQSQGKYEYTVVNENLQKARAEVVAIVKKELNAPHSNTDGEIFKVPSPVSGRRKG